jgi:uncharacterized protein YecE (DUF72 family)
MHWNVGTSGFSYDAWSGSFYPEDLPGADRLAFYAERLPSVEINNTFYRMPKTAVLAGWAERVPEPFRFALKAPRSITHKKDAQPEDAVPHLFRMTEALGERLGPVLFQLPPWARKDIPKLRALLAPVPPGRKIALEFRHPSWQDDEVMNVLRDASAALCAADFDDAAKRVPLIATASFGYVRLRAADYDDTQLRTWAEQIDQQAWNECFVFFKHEDAGAAPKLAERLLTLTNSEWSARKGPKRAPTPKKPIQRAQPTRRAKTEKPPHP